MMRILTIAAVMLLAACKTVPESTRVPPPQIVEVPVETFVPIPDTLLAPCQWRKSAPPSQVFEVARERKACLERYEADREAIRRIRGKAR